MTSDLVRRKLDVVCHSEGSIYEKVMKLKAASSGKMDNNEKRANKVIGWMNCEVSREATAKTDMGWKDRERRWKIVTGLKRSN